MLHTYQEKKIELYFILFINKCILFINKVNLHLFTKKHQKSTIFLYFHVYLFLSFSYCMTFELFPGQHLLKKKLPSSTSILNHNPKSLYLLKKKKNFFINSVSLIKKKHFEQEVEKTE